MRLGRTGFQSPDLWYRLVSREPDDLERIARGAAETGAVLDVSATPGLWGSFLRGDSNHLSLEMGEGLRHATDTSHAAELVQAELVQHLSALGRMTIDFVFWRYSRALEEYAIEGALQTFEMAIQEGNIRFLGLACPGNELAALGMWQFHDAFSVLGVPMDSRPYTTLVPLAQERNVGVVGWSPRTGNETVSHPIRVDFELSK